MSLGYGWCANLVQNDDATAAYSYCTYDLSLPSEKNGWNVTEDDGLMWVYVADDGSLEIELEKPSRYCSGKGPYSAKALFFACANRIEARYQDEGSLPRKVSGNI